MIGLKGIISGFISKEAFIIFVLIFILREVFIIFHEKTQNPKSFGDDVCVCVCVCVCVYCDIECCE
jgi:hypothetical protein